MKLQTTGWLVVISFALLRSASGQDFVNLDFEQANVAGDVPGENDVPITDAFPGWTAIYTSYTNPTGTNVATQVWYDGISLGGNIISIDDINAITPIQGNYMAALFGTFAVSSTLSQTGLVPVGTKTLLADMYAPGGSSTFSVTLDGQTISMIPLQTFSNYTLYGGDISAFAGQVSQVSFTSLIGGEPNELLLDNIQFSSSSVPEPSVFGLLALGGLFYSLRRSK